VRSPADLEDKLNSHVVKKITVAARRHKDGTITAKTVIELHDAQGALEKLARHHGLFKDRLDITTGDQPFTIDELAQAAKELEDWQDENRPEPDTAD
jgi:nucleoside-diphosphate-sugar epimerase